MKNPFIILTSATSDSKVRVNINHIITYAAIKYKNSDKYFTYMTNASPAMTDTKFKEAVKKIDQMIAEYYN
jgi:hypothetical protein